MSDGIFSPSNPGSTPKEHAAQITQVSVKIFFCNDETKHTAIAAAKLANLALSRVLCLSSSSPALYLTKQEQGQTIFFSPSFSLLGVHHPPFNPPQQQNLHTLLPGHDRHPRSLPPLHTNIVSEAALAIDANSEFYAR